MVLLHRKFTQRGPGLSPRPKSLLTLIFGEVKKKQSVAFVFLTSTVYCIVTFSKVILDLVSGYSLSGIKFPADVKMLGINTDE